MYRACARCRAQDQANTAARRNKRKLAESQGQPRPQRVWTDTATDLQAGVDSHAGVGSAGLGAGASARTDTGVGIERDASAPEAGDPDREDTGCDSDTDDETVDMVRAACQGFESSW